MLWQTSLSLTLGLLVFSMGFATAKAADIGGSCCTELEDRVAELEATATRKGNSKVSLTVSGQINYALLWWDDGHEANTYVVGNANDNLSMFRFEGEATVGAGWSAGYLIELEITNSASSGVNQLDDDGQAGVGTSDASMWIANERLGKVTWGFAAQPSDGAPEVDLSGTGYVGYSAVDSAAGGFFLRRTDDVLVQDVMIGDFMNNLNGGTFSIIRYDTPEIAGFTLSASWGEDDIWDVALNYAGDFKTLKLEGAIAYAQNSDEDAGEPEIDNNTIIGSISALHKPTGLNVTFAAGRREFKQQFTDNAGSLTTRDDDQVFYYVKGGWLKNVTGLGNTALYAEYGHYQDFLSNDADSTVVAALDPSGLTVCTGSAGCLISGSRAHIWGLGLVQYIDAAAMQLYVGYRHYEMEAGLTDVSSTPVQTVSLEDFDTVMAGMRIEF